MGKWNLQEKIQSPWRERNPINRRSRKQQSLRRKHEVDSASNNLVLLDFLAQLRMHYLNREEVPTFRSVILAGVYDIKNLKSKIRSNEEHQYNSPWNTRESNEENFESGIFA